MISKHMSHKEDWLKIAAFIVSMIIYFANTRCRNGKWLRWNPSCEATPFAPEKWPFQRDGLSSGVEINTFMFRFTLSSGLSRGGGLSSGWPLKRGSTVVCQPFMP